MKKIYKNLIIFLLTLFAFSCASVDFDKSVVKNKTSVAQPKGAKANENQESDTVPIPDVIVVERPVFVPEKEAARIPPSGLDAVKSSNLAGIIKPSDYSHAAIVYDYNPDWVYEIYAMPLRVCDIRLEPGERALDVPFISDSERWNLGAGISLENSASIQHIYVKPAAANQEASLIINTDRRVYHIILRSYANTFMPLVRWRYHSGLPQNYLSSGLDNSSTVNLSSVQADVASEQINPFPGVDPRFLSFNYRMTYKLSSKPVWLPKLIFDDGSKTYITFPDQVLQRELPTVFENRKDVINYRVMGNIIVIDKLIESITIKIGRKEITVTKKRG